MNYYKGISLSRNENLFNYIQTYHATDSELREAYMEADIGLQRLVKIHYLKRKSFVILFNISFYIVPLLAYISKQG